MKIAKADPDAVQFFKTIVPKDPRVTIKPMFGNLSAFVNGNMFMGVYGDELFVRLSETQQGELLKHKGAGPFEVMPGRVMSGYIIMPKTWREGQNDTLRKWITTSLEFAAKLPPKKKKAAAAKKKC
jgi:TfoX/Sxy family transcriptional regulator of competence genes